MPEAPSRPFVRRWNGVVLPGHPDEGSHHLDALIVAGRPGEFQLFANACQHLLDCLDRHRSHPSDLGGGVTLRDRTQHLDLGRGEFGQRIDGAPDPVGARKGDSRADVIAATRIEMSSTSDFARYLNPAGHRGMSVVSNRGSR